MKPPKRSKSFRKQERMHLSQVRYYLRQGMYIDALRSLGWLIRADTIADEAEHAEEAEKEAAAAEEQARAIIGASPSRRCPPRSK